MKIYCLVVVVSAAIVRMALGARGVSRTRMDGDRGPRDSCVVSDGDDNDVRVSAGLTNIADSKGVDVIVVAIVIVFAIRSRIGRLGSSGSRGLARGFARVFARGGLGTGAGAGQGAIGRTPAFSCFLGTIFDQVASWELIKQAKNILVECSRDRALVHLVLTLQVEHMARLNKAGQIGAFIDSLLENIHIPSVHKVTMVPEPGGVTGRKHKLALLTRKGVNIPNRLKEQADKSGLVAIRASTVIHERRVTHMVTVILGVEVLAIPARREENLRTKSIHTVVSHVIGHLPESQSSVGWCSVVETVEANSLLAQGILGPVAGDPVRLFNFGVGETTEVRVSGNHTETGGECFDVGTTGKIVARQKLAIGPVM